jgi:predicted TIM-barrel fold metal-dependent hydrolase
MRDLARAPAAGQMLFDAHFHIIDPGFPLVPSQGFRPAPFPVDDYLRLAKPLDIRAGAVVSGSFQGFDQGYLCAALDRLGPGFVGVTQLAPETPDAIVRDLAERGVRGLRFNIRRGLSSSRQNMERLARRVFDLVGWHVEIYADAAELADCDDWLRRLPALSIDHLGLSGRGLPLLLRLAERGVRVKASGFGRVDLDVAEALCRLHEANPQALMFGSDLPSTRARKPFNPDDIGLIRQALGDAGAEQVLWHNAADFYRLPAPVHPWTQSAAP